MELRSLVQGDNQKIDPQPISGNMILFIDSVTLRFIITGMSNAYRCCFHVILPAVSVPCPFPGCVGPYVEDRCSMEDFWLQLMETLWRRYSPSRSPGRHVVGVWLFRWEWSTTPLQHGILLDFLSGLSPIAPILSIGNSLGNEGRLIGGRPVLAKSPLRHRVSARFKSKPAPR